jgi:hypothetical protein
MIRTLLATAALVGLMGLGAQTASAQMTMGAGPPPQPAKRCDSDGCWTYHCDASSNHCHRHWISSTPPDANAPADTTHQDQLCDRTGENCQPALPH